VLLGQEYDCSWTHLLTHTHTHTHSLSHTHTHTHTHTYMGCKSLSLSLSPSLNIPSYYHFLIQSFLHFCLSSRIMIGHYWYKWSLPLLPSFLSSFLVTYLPTYLPSYLPTYLPIYLLSFLHPSLSSLGPSSFCASSSISISTSTFSFSSPTSLLSLLLSSSL